MTSRLIAVLMVAFAVLFLFAEPASAQLNLQESAPAVDASSISSAASATAGLLGAGFEEQAAIGSFGSFLDAPSISSAADATAATAGLLGAGFEEQAAIGIFGSVGGLLGGLFGGGGDGEDPLLTERQRADRVGASRAAVARAAYSAARQRSARIVGLNQRLTGVVTGAASLRPSAAAHVARVKLAAARSAAAAEARRLRASIPRSGRNTVEQSGGGEARLPSVAHGSSSPSPGGSEYERAMRTLFPGVREDGTYSRTGGVSGATDAGRTAVTAVNGSPVGPTGGVVGGSEYERAMRTLFPGVREGGGYSRTGGVSGAADAGRTAAGGSPAGPTGGVAGGSEYERAMRALFPGVREGRVDPGAKERK